MSRRVELIFALFMVSGFGGLIYESVWTHYLKLFLGHAAYAQTLVLIVFIGGLALGSWICARFAGRIVNPLRWYAAVELAVGAMALVFHPVFVAVTEWAYTSLMPATCAASQSFCATQWLLSALLLLPQSVLIGATFPLVSSAVIRLEPTAPGHHVAMLYFLNSLGAVFGVLASIFVLIPAFGLGGTLAFAGAANAALAAGAFVLARLTPPAFAVPQMDAAPDTREHAGRTLLVLLLATALLTGLSSFIYEIVWIRMLSLVLGASTYSFELMLASFILGLALGGLWVRNRIDAVDDPVRFLGLVQIVMGVAAAGTLVIYGGSFDFMAWLLTSVSRDSGGFLIFNLGSITISLLVMLPATFCAGMTLPLITYRLMRTSYGERAIGLVYSANTLGSIAGVVVAVHLLMTWLGLHGALVVAASIDVGLGVVLLVVRTRGVSAPRRSVWSIPAAIAVLVVVAVAFPIDTRRSASGVFRDGAARLPARASVEFHKDGKTATVDVLDEGGLRAIRTNGKTDAAIQMNRALAPSPDELTMAMLALMPLSYAPQAKAAALIGFGSGMSTDVMLRSPNIRRVDTIEIEPAMVEGARRFLPVVNGAFADPRSRVVIDDAKSYFARGRERYDIIVSEPSNPWVSGVASLFTEEFYRRLAKSLNDGGVLSQWIHTYEMDSIGLASIFNAVAKTFPDFRLYSSNDGDIILVARKGGPLGAMDTGVLAWPSMAPIVGRLKIGNPDVLERRMAGSSASVLALFRPMGVPANSDYRPLLEQRTSKTRFTRENVPDLIQLQVADMPLLELFDGGSPPLDHPVESVLAGASDRAAENAWSFRHVVMDPGFVPSAPLPAANSSEHAARLIGLWAQSCPAGVSFDRLLPSMVTAAELINPRLGKGAASGMWRHLLGSQCGRRLPAGERRWLELFEAVALRDAEAMSRLGTGILDAAKGTRNDLTRYAFEATATGLICQGRMEEADRLFDLGTHDWLPAGGGSTELRFLYAIASSPAGAARPATGSCAARKPS